MNSYIAKQKKIIKQDQLIDDIIEKAGYCHLCGYNSEPLIIQNHHIAGKNNNNTTIPVCTNCHAILTKDQTTWNKDWSKKDKSSDKKDSFMLKGIATILRLIADFLDNASNKQLKGEI